LADITEVGESQFPKPMVASNAGGNATTTNAQAVAPVISPGRMTEKHPKTFALAGNPPMLQPMKTASETSE
jgi:hypothetical protein